MTACKKNSPQIHEKVNGHTGLFPVLVDDHDIGEVAVLGELNNVFHLELRLAFYKVGVGEDIHKLCSEFIYRLVLQTRNEEALVSFCPLFVHSSIEKSKKKESFLMYA